MFGYVPLWCKSNFSFLEGGSHPEELIDTALELALPAIAVTDRDGVYGLVRAHARARARPVKLICGAQLSLAEPGATLSGSPITVSDEQGRGPGWDHAPDDASASSATTSSPRSRRARARAKRGPARQGAASIGAPSQLVLLATDRIGWSNLTRLITIGRRRCDKGQALVAWPEVCQHAGGLLALWGGAQSLLSSEAGPPASLVGELRDAFADRLYAMLTRHCTSAEVATEPRLISRASAAQLPLVASTEVLYHVRARRPLQDVLTCIRHGVTVMTAGRKIRGNDQHALHRPADFAALFADHPAAIACTREIADRVTFALDELRYRYPSERLPDGTTSADHLRALTFAGAERRYGDDEIPYAVRRQLNTELALIEELDYPGYFLTMYEVVTFCQRRGILCQGRGSAANSAVCFCLGITAIDPVRMNFLFERFLSRERHEPPDIDLDIEHARREEVIQHIYTVYGRDHAAMVCNIIRYRPRSAVRDVGKALGVPETTLNRIARQLSSHGDLDDEALATTELVGQRAGILGHLARLSREILEFPRHLSIHPGGFLLGHAPVHDLVPIENAAMADRTVIQWDKDDLEELGLFKVDLLALGALHQIHLALDLLRDHRGLELTMATIPPEDPDTYDLLCTADTVGVFQVESRAQMAMLPRLKPRHFYDLVIEISLVRPGPITGGMVHPYLRRRDELEPVDYPHPSLKPVLARTLGIPLFQEQVMKLAIVGADYTPGEADQLRRDMAAWRRCGRIDQHRERLIGRMVGKGIAPEFAERVFEQIRGFGEYGFPESHAASFALIAYATAWLRRHYPAEFLCALLNAQPMGFYAPSTIIGDAQRHAVEVRPIDVQHSAWEATLEPADDAFDFAVRVGLRWIQGLRSADGERIVAARRDGPFTSLAEFVSRCRLSGRAHTALAQAGALAAFGSHGSAARRAAIWQVQGWVVRQDDTLPLGGGDGDDLPFRDLTFAEEIRWDYGASDHSTRGHPLAPLRAELRSRGWPDARTVQRGRDGQHVDYVGVVICRQQPSTASGVAFFTLEDETGFVNIVVWRRVLAKHGLILRTASPLGVSGRLQVQEQVVHLIVEEAWVPPLSRAPAAVASRDFR